jgi:hypothetical protein
MARYRKRPVVIEAVQLKWENWSEICDFAGVGPREEGKPHGCYVTEDGQATDLYPGPRPDSPVSRIGLQIPTLEGVMLAVEGDWIIRGVQGELYPCKPDIFDQTYEPVEKTLDEILAPYTGEGRRRYDNLENENITEHDRRSDAGL